MPIIEITSVVDEVNEETSECTERTISLSESSDRDVIVKWISRFKEKHHLTQSAVKDIVEFAQVIHSYAISKACEQIATLSKDKDSMNAIQNIQHPLKGLESEYLLRMHLKKNFPYVVSFASSIGLTHLCLIIKTICVNVGSGVGRTRN